MASSDETWGEHEIDYIFFVQADVELRPNGNEVQATRYVSAPDLKAMLQQEDLHFTPWFKLICDEHLFQWWECLGALEGLRNDKIVRMI
jgi:isopentenyl-diphosphate delta-isomerase